MKSYQAYYIHADSKEVFGDSLAEATLQAENFCDEDDRVAGVYLNV